MLLQFLLASTLVSPDPEFVKLHQLLEHYGFEVRFELPPRRGTYGLLRHDSQTIWINPVVFDLNIAQTTLVHEAVHAAQSCAGTENLKILGVNIPPPMVTKPFWIRYHSHRRDLETEAYTIQVQPNGTDLAIELLNQYCS